MGAKRHSLCESDAIAASGSLAAAGLARLLTFQRPGACALFIALRPQFFPALRQPGRSLRQRPLLLPPLTVSVVQPQDRGQTAAHLLADDCPIGRVDQPVAIDV